MKKRELIIEGSIAKVPLTRGFFAIIDIADADKIMKWNWQALVPRKGVVYAAAKGGRLLMHRFLLELTDPKIQGDHINADGLDNRRSNLRACTNQQNNFNRRKTSGRFKGVTFDKARNKWAASIMLNGKRIGLGRYDVEEDGARAYDAKAKEIYGEFARLNFNS